MELTVASLIVLANYCRDVLSIKPTLIAILHSNGMLEKWIDETGFLYRISQKQGD